MVSHRLDVWEIVEGHEDVGREAMIAKDSLSERAVDLALAYRDRYPREIDDAVNENRRPIEYWQERSTVR